MPLDDCFADRRINFRFGQLLDEFGMLAVPRPVRFLFPVIVAVGRLLGWDRRFAGAPEPIRRS